MSFILDALKKLEREKEARDPGVVMVQPVAWGESDRRRGPGLAVAGTVLVLLLGGSFLWLRSEGEPPAAGNESGEPASAAIGAETPVVPEPAPPSGALVPEAGPADRTGGPEPPPPGDAIPPPSRVLPPSGGTPAPEAPPVASGEPIPPDTRTAAPAPFEEPLVVPSIADTAVAPPEEPAAPPDAPPEPEFRLTAISSRDGQPIALLNDRLVREGDRFGDITILEIGETSIEIEVKGKRQTVSF